MVAISRVTPDVPTVRTNDSSATTDAAPVRRSSAGVGEVTSNFDVVANTDAALAEVLGSDIGPNVTGAPSSEVPDVQTFRIPFGVSGLMSATSTAADRPTSSSADFAARLKEATGLTVEEFNATEKGPYLNSTSFLHDRIKEVQGCLNADGTWNWDAGNGMSSKYAFAKVASLIPGPPSPEKMQKIADILGPEVGHLDPVTGQYDLLGEKGGDGLVTIGKGPSGQLEFNWTYYEEGDAHVGHPNGWPGDDVRVSTLDSAWLEAWGKLPSLEDRGYWINKMRVHAPDNKDEDVTYWRNRMLGMDASTADRPPYGPWGTTGQAAPVTT